MTLSLKNLIFAFVLFAVCVSAVGFFLMPAMVQGRLKAFLVAHGADEVMVPIPVRQGDSFLFSDIKLDRDGFSRIETVTTPLALSFFLQPGIEILTFEGVTLTGEINNKRIFSVEGLNFKDQKQYIDTSRIVFKNSKIDLDTPSGIIRLEGEGTVTHDSLKGARVIDATLWGEQHQLVLSARTETTLYSDGLWKMDADISRGRFNLDPLKVSRLSGWISAEKEKSGASLPRISGQIDAGRLDLNGLALNDVLLTVHGSPMAYNIGLQGQVAGYRNMNLSLNMQHTTNGPVVDMAVDASLLDDLAGFLEVFHQSLSDVPGASAFVTPLLLTPGNIERLRRALRTTVPERLILKIEGPLYSLSGKIIVEEKKDGSLHRHIISLDPGDAGLE